jgi:hypothetical protein
MNTCEFNGLRTGRSFELALGEGDVGDAGRLGEDRQVFEPQGEES